MARGVVHRTLTTETLEDKTAGVEGWFDNCKVRVSSCVASKGSP